MYRVTYCWQYTWCRRGLAKFQAALSKLQNAIGNTSLDALEDIRKVILPPFLCIPSSSIPTLSNRLHQLQTHSIPTTSKPSMAGREQTAVTISLDKVDGKCQ